MIKEVMIKINDERYKDIVTYKRVNLNMCPKDEIPESYIEVAATYKVASPWWVTFYFAETEEDIEELGRILYRRSIAASLGYRTNYQQINVVK